MTTAPRSDLGLRERKAAATRTALVASLKRRLASAPLDEITAEQLAADANVSRVTFHNYFPTKEHAIDHLIAGWMLEVSAAVARKKVRGLAAIVELFEANGRIIAQEPRAMLRVYGHLATRLPTRPLPTLTVADRWSIVPDVDTSQLPLGSTGALFMTALEEAKREDGYLFEGTVYELAHYLGSLLNGAAVTGQSSPDTDFERLFQRHVRRALGLGFGGGHGLPAVAAPRTPERYRAKPAKPSRHAQKPTVRVKAKRGAR